MDNASLIKLCQKGDKEALGLLYSSRSKQMMRIVCHYIMDWNAAQDILHDGFLIIFSRIGQLKDPAKLEHWMSAIMKNLSLQYLKEQDVMKLLDDDLDIPDVPEFEESISMEELEAMIRRLPSGYQKVFRLAVLEHKSHKEIGKLLGISEGTSGSQLFHARVLIRKMIINHKIETMLIAAAAIVLGFIAIRDKRETQIQPPGIVEVKTPIFTEQPSPCDVNLLPVDEIAPKAATRHAAIIDETETAMPADTLHVFPDLQPEQAVAQAVIEEQSQTSDTVISSAPHIEPQAQLALDAICAPQQSKGLIASISGNMQFGPTESSTRFHILDPRSYYCNNYGTLGPVNSTLGPVNGYDNADDTPSTRYAHNLPVTISLSLSKSLTSRLSVESGLQYTWLQTNFKGRYSQGSINAHYIGIPLKARICAYSAGRFSLYGSAGAMAELPLHGSVSTSYINDVENSVTYTPPVQWSTSLGIGIEYSPAKHIGIFVEPSANYYFKASSPYATIRQDRPFEFAIPVGLRYKW